MLAQRDSGFFVFKPAFVTAYSPTSNRAVGTQ